MVDLGDRAAVVDFVDSWTGDLYGLINNAATNVPEHLSTSIRPIEDVLDSWDRVLSVNLVAPMLLCRGLLGAISRPGRIINIASQLAHEGRAGYSAYCSSKAGLVGLTRSLAKELGRDGVTVNAVSPGWVRTELHDAKLDVYAGRLGVTRAEAEAVITRPLELKRFNEMCEVAKIVAFLLSDAGCGVSGQSWLMSTVYSHE